MAQEYVLINKLKLEKIEKDVHREKMDTSTNEDIISEGDTTEGDNTTQGQCDDTTLGDNECTEPIPSSSSASTDRNAKVHTAMAKFIDFDNINHTDDYYANYDDDDDDDDDVLYNVLKHRKIRGYQYGDILSVFSENGRHKVRPILDAIGKASPGVIDWNRQTGHLIYKGKQVEHSNIITLLFDSMVGVHDCWGKYQFYRALEEINLNPKLVAPRNRQVMLSIKAKEIDSNKSNQKKKSLKKIKKKHNIQKKTVKEWLKW